MRTFSEEAISLAPLSTDSNLADSLLRKAISAPMNNLNAPLFTGPNPESTGGLLKNDQRQEASRKLSGPAVIRRPFGEPIPLSIAQHQVWLHGQLAPSVPLYNEALIFERTGPLN